MSGNRRRPWIARITVGWSDEGKQLYKILGYFKTRKEAQICLAEYNKDPYDVDMRKLTFKEVFERWAAEHYPNISQSKINSYNTIFNQSEPIHDMPFHKIKTVNLQSLINDKRHLKASTLGHHKSTYKQIFQYAIKNEIAIKNYADFIEIPKSGKSERKSKIFSQDEIKTVIAHYEAGVPYADVVLILLFTGFRIMELMSVKKTDVFLNDRYIVGGFKTEAGKNRIVPISRKILPLIERRMQGESEYLIPTPKGCMWKYQNFRTDIWVPMMKDMGMSHTAHNTRHTFVSMMSKAGVDRIVIQRIVGHSDRDVTDHYTHVEIKRLIEAIDMI